MSFAQSLPGSADTGRIKPIKPFQVQPDAAIPESRQNDGTINIPPEFRQISFQLRDVEIVDSSAFTQADLASVYAEYIDRTITLDIAWIIAERISKLYRDKGYFLSRAFVPAQAIENGSLTIQIVEGYVGSVGFEGGQDGVGSVTAELVSELRNARPITTDKLESFMLRLNEVSGHQNMGILQKIENGDPGAVKLLVREAGLDPKFFLNFNNYGSRFLGPYQMSMLYKDHFLDEQETSVFVSASIPLDELKQFNLSHQIPIRPTVSWHASTSYILAHPGGRLNINEIESVSKELKSGITWQPIRQRSENLRMNLNMSFLNTDADILGSETLTRDRVRVLEGQVLYDTVDRRGAFNNIGVTIKQGVDIFGASGAGDQNLSRTQAEPDFTVLSVDYNRQQFIHDDFLLISKISGQAASKPLYSSQEFGYGGYAFGRAYDPSEVLGDHGVSGSAELRYTGFKPRHELNYSPYVFYDIGKVWNEDEGSVDASAVSAGFGVVLEYKKTVNADIGLAWPLTKPADEPQYGDDQNPRVLLQINYGF